MARFFLAFALFVFLAACTPPTQAKNAAGASGQKRDDIQEARQLRQSGKAAEAVTLLQAAAVKQPDNPELLAQLGYAQIANSQPEDAINTFDRLIAIAPGDAVAYDGKAIAFDHAGNHLAAQELYQYALKLAPGSVRIQNNLAMSLILNGQFDQAIGRLEALNTVAGGNLTVRQNLALAYGLSGQDEKALALNLQDLPPEQAKENLRFYETYKKHQSLKEAGAAAPKQIGFAEAPSATRNDAGKSHPQGGALKPAKDEPAASNPTPDD
ncbi:MAG: tetratricopeptide repeat protein [Pseudomonadota bacterium]|nr:tetratricopeptide repeat protein [Pseudomonadota bacterium]MDE3038631.1 tetratricopeptide repeat protein [Pseudomonadota bacterium]